MRQRDRFTCIPEDPNTPGHDPMCSDRNGLEWLKSVLTHEKPPEGKIWFGYMLTGGSDASNDDPYPLLTPYMVEIAMLSANRRSSE